MKSAMILGIIGSFTFSVALLVPVMIGSSNDILVPYSEKVAPSVPIPKNQVGLIYLLGYILYWSDQYELAEQQFVLIIEKFPNSDLAGSAWYIIGHLNYELQIYETSRETFNAFLHGFPDSDFRDDARLLIAQSLLNESSYEQAYQEFDKIASEDFNYPDLQAEAMYKAAYCLNQFGRDSEAIEHYTSFIEQFPMSQYVAAAYFDQGAIYAKHKDYHNARATYELALQSTSDSVFQSEIQVAIGQAYYDQGDSENAIIVYTKLLEEYPAVEGYVAEARLGIADSHFRSENWNEAIVAYKRLINRHPQEVDFVPHSSYRIGAAYYKLSINQKDAGQENRAIATLKLALQWYQRTLDNYPQDPIAPYVRYEAVMVLDKLRRREELEDVAREFIYRYRYDREFSFRVTMVRLKLADFLRHEKRFAEAVIEYQAVYDSNPTDEYADRALYLVGRCYYLANSDDPALLRQSEAAFKRVINEYENSRYAADAYYGLVLVYRDTSRWSLLLEIADEANNKYATSADERVRQTLRDIALIRDNVIKDMEKGPSR